MPTLAGIREFQVEVATGILAAAGIRDERRALTWISAVQDRAATYESLAYCPEDLRALDRKLAKALEKIIKGDLAIAL